MLQIENTLISNDVLEEFFCCDLSVCKGICCVEGDSGAPLEPQEVEILKENFDHYKEYLNNSGLKKIEKIGFGVIDKDGDLGTPLVKNADCVYAIKCKGITMCACEKAFLDGKMTWKKPISCHLYPIRLSKIGDFVALNYHRWDVCNCARKLGKKNNIRVYQFLKEPLIRRFGEDWYNQLCIAAQEYFKIK